MDFTDQIVLVTGSSRGLGASIARAFHKRGAKVVINHVSEESIDIAQELAKELGNDVLVIRADVTNPEDTQRLFAITRRIFGRPFTTIVNNFLPSFSFNGEARSKANDIPWAEFDSQLAAVRGALNTTQVLLTSRAAPREATRCSTRIINIGSNLVHNPVVPYHAYISAKAALLGITRSLAHELGSEGINVNMVSGGLLRETNASRATPVEVWQAIEDQTPLRRVCTPEDVADVCLFLASDWSRGMTGQELVVDGGLVMK